MSAGNKSHKESQRKWLGDDMNQDKIWDVYQNDPELVDVGCRNAGRIQFVAKRIPSQSKVLNIGVGQGRLEDILAKRGVDVYSLDPSETSINRIRELIAVGEDHAKVGYAQAIPFQEESFDFVIMTEVLEHLTDGVLASALAEVKRVLRKGGTFIGTVPADEDLKKSIVVCPRCGARFHRWGHEQSFSESRLRLILGSVFPVVKVSRKYFIHYAELNWKGKIVDTLKLFQAFMGFRGSNQNFYFEAQK